MKTPLLSTTMLSVALVLSGCGTDARNTDEAASTSEVVSTQDAAQDTAGVADADDSAGSSAASSASPDEQAGGTDEESRDDSGSKDPSQEYDYEDEPEPAPELAATLCNLDADYFKNLRGTDSSGKAVADDSLRMAVLSLGDNLSLWIDLQRSFPDVADDVARAQKIYDYWDEALLQADNGDPDAAQKAMERAEVEIDRLPGRAPDAVEGCSS